MHRPWFSPAEYKQLYEATRQNAKEPKNPYFRWEAEQLHDFVLFMGNTSVRPDEAKQLQHRDVTIVQDPDSRERILEIQVRGKRGIGWCKSMPGAVKPYERLRDRAKPVRGKDATDTGELPAPTDLVFPGNYLKMFNKLLEVQHLKLDRDGKPRTAYSLRHTYICLRLMEGQMSTPLAKTAARRPQAQAADQSGTEGAEGGGSAALPRKRSSTASSRRPNGCPDEPLAGSQRPLGGALTEGLAFSLSGHALPRGRSRLVIL